MLRDWQTPPGVEPAAVDEAAPPRPVSGSPPSTAAPPPPDAAPPATAATPPPPVAAPRSTAPAHPSGAAGTVPPSLPRWLHATWSPAGMESLARRLAGAARELRELPAERLAAAWSGAVETFRDPASAARRRLEPALVHTTGLSPEGLAAALETVLGGVAGPAAGDLLRRTRPAADGAPVLVVLASNLPALAVQPLLPALARRRPAILKSPSAEPLFAAAFAAELARREPALGRAVAALTWPGGDHALEAPLLAAAGPILAYGDAPALADLARRADAARPGEPGRVVPYGPRTSLAVVGPGALATEAALLRTAAGLARDVALFDQRGCLSVAAVYVLADGGGPAGTGGPGRGGQAPGEAETAGAAGGGRRGSLPGTAEGAPERTGRAAMEEPGGPAAGERAAELAGKLAAALAGELAVLARRWPPGAAAAEPARAAAVRQLREEAALRGSWVADLPLATGTVLVEPHPPFRPTPGLRTVRVHPLPEPSALATALAGWEGRLQGTAVAGLAGVGPGAGDRVEALLRGLGVSRIAPPGELQSPDVRWHNGGVDPLEVLG